MSESKHLNQNPVTMKPLHILLPALMALIFSPAALPAASVENVTAKQRYPWNGKVDISYTITGNDAGSIKVSAKDGDTGMSYTVTSLTGDVSTAAGTHSIVWDAAADLGEDRFTNMVVRVNVSSTVQLWKGGPYWAMKNIGAENPWDYGYYFWWGDTIGYKRRGNAWVASDGSSQNYTFTTENTPTCKKSNSTLQSEGWITANGVLAPAHDAARVHCGSSWRMPTDAELSALVNNCDWTWTTTHGVNGYVVRGRGDFTGASIFLPAAGRGEKSSFSYAGSWGFYWSSVPYADWYYDAWHLTFASGRHEVTYYTRYYGQVVRPIQEITE